MGWAGASRSSRRKPLISTVQIAKALEASEASGSPGARLQIGGLASVLSLPLAHHPDLLRYAVGLQALETGDQQTAEDLLGELGDKEIVVGAPAVVTRSVPLRLVAPV